MTQPADARDANYVLTLEEIGNLAEASGKPAETLMNVVALIAARAKTDVCSVYLLEPDRANLVLAASVGLRSECIGTLRLALNEGLAGLVAEQVRPVAVGQVASHPRFKYFREAGEDSYQSFLGVPIVDRGVLQGVLVVQTVQTRTFPDDEIRMLTEGAAQVALGSGFHQPVPRPRPSALERAQPQSDFPALRDPLVEARTPRRRSGAAW